MVIGCDIMVQLGILEKFKHKILKWGGARLIMKEPSGILGQTNLTSREMIKVVMQTEEPVSTREDTERLVKILDSTYAKIDLEQVSANATHLNAEEINQLLRLLKYFEGLFDGTI